MGKRGSEKFLFRYSQKHSIMHLPSGHGLCQLCRQQKQPWHKSPGCPLSWTWRYTVGTCLHPDPSAICQCNWRTRRRVKIGPNKVRGSSWHRPVFDCLWCWLTSFPGSPRARMKNQNFPVLQATESWAGPGNEARYWWEGLEMKPYSS